MRQFDHDRVLGISERAAVVDGSSPLDEATTWALREGRGELIVEDDGFAYVVGGELTLVVAPDARGRGLGGRLLGTAASYGVERAWSHADHPAARALAAGQGWHAVRELWVMRRPAHLPLPPLPQVDGVNLRHYRPDDAAEILRVNAAAFADHPEQGAMDAANLATRMTEPWFDPAGLLVVERNDQPGLAGFHWTKRHSPTHGEVYVVGVDPAAQGRGLGKLATLAGLHHLYDGGAEEIVLYVEGDNLPAIAVYAGLGFSHDPRDTHVMYQAPRADLVSPGRVI